MRFRRRPEGYLWPVSRMSRHERAESAAPEAESPEIRSTEQEVASGRTAATPVSVIGGVVGVVALAVAVVLVLVVVAYSLA